MQTKHFLYERVCHYIKEEWLNVRETIILGKRLFGKQIMHQHKVLWNINGFNYIGIPFMELSQKR